jgi:hypothetical protein
MPDLVAERDEREIDASCRESEKGCFDVVAEVGG